MASLAAVDPMRVYRNIIDGTPIALYDFYMSRAAPGAAAGDMQITEITWGIDVAQKSKNLSGNKRLLLAGIIVAAVVVAVALVVLSSQSSFSEVALDYSAIPQGRQPDGGFVLGDPAAPITIVAFEDFLCGHCQRYKSTVEKFIDAYVATGMARFEYRFLPVVHQGYSPQAAKLTECAETLRPGAFWQAHDVMFSVASARAFSDTSARTFADQMDLSYSALLECTQDANQVNIDTQLATQLDVTGTPTVMFRLGDSAPQRSPLGQQPTFEQLGLLVQQVGG